MIHLPYLHAQHQVHLRRLQSLPHPDLRHHGLSHRRGPAHEAAAARGPSPRIPGRGAPPQPLLWQLGVRLQLQLPHHYSAAPEAHPTRGGRQYFVRAIRHTWNNSVIPRHLSPPCFSSSISDDDEVPPLSSKFGDIYPMSSYEETSVVSAATVNGLHGDVNGEAESATLKAGVSSAQCN